MDQCLSEMPTTSGAIPARWSVLASRDPMDRNAWRKLEVSMSEKDTKEQIERRHVANAQLRIL
jgi:hypothetical protein